LDTDTIDLLKLLRLFRRKFWIIFLSTVLGLLISGAITYFYIPKQYSANVLLYIWQDNDDGQTNNLTINDLNMFAQLVNDYQVLVKSRLVTQRVAEQMLLGPDQAETLGSRITVATKANTRHITITAVDLDPQISAIIANTVASVFSTAVVEKMGAANVQIIDLAVVPTEPSSPNLKLNIALGALIGIFLAVGLILLTEFLNTTVRTVDDVESLTGYTLLGTIPEFEPSPVITKAAADARKETVRKKP
jgi:capsular polysaccharide biosynthesis protein